MRCLAVSLLLMVGWDGSSPQGQADERLPPPRVLPEASPAPAVVVPYHPPVPFAAYHRTSRYAHWYLVELDRQSFFRPVVVYRPHGQFYLYNGEPYPWAPLYPNFYAPYVVGPR